MRNPFGWDLPPGCTNADIDRAAGYFPQSTLERDMERADYLRDCELDRLAEEKINQKKKKGLQSE